MRNKQTSKIIVFLLCFLAQASISFAQLSPPAAYTHVAVNTGRWGTPSVWQGGQVPNDDAIVHIPAGITVGIVRQESARVRYLQIEGELKMAGTVNTRLYVETIFVAPTGTFRVAEVGAPVQSDKTAEVVFISDGSPIDLTWDANEASRGMLSAGKLRIYGHPKTNMVAMANDVLAGQNSLAVNNTVPTDWVSGDSIVLTGTHFRRFTDFQDEKLTIDQISGNTIDIDQNLQYDHVRVKSDMNLHIANLSRNVIFRSETTTPTYNRSHLMIRNADTDIYYAAFKDMGRTDKSIPLDEIEVDFDTETISPGLSLNRRGRYAVHFHINGIKASATEPPSKVYGCVVTNTIGWGFVNHSSHVDFQDNVCHNFVGSAFVTEFGDELGNFYNNIAIRGTGNGEYRPIRVVFANEERSQPLSDFGFSGDGFWFQGPAVRVRDNVANGCNGAGMIWFTTGAVDIGTNYYVGFPRDSVAPAYINDFPDINTLEARSWIYDSDALVIADLPILECKNFEAYGCLVGFRLRFNNSNSMSFYNEAWFGYDDDIVPVPGHTSKNYANRLVQNIGNIKCWNNEQGFRMRYTTKADWTNVEVVNRLAYHPVLPYVGAEFHHQVFEHSIDTLLIDGYALAGWVVDKDDNNMSGGMEEVSISNETYLNCANSDTWNKDSVCQVVSNLSVPISSSVAARVNWSAHPKADTILLRYRPVSGTYWSYTTKIGASSTGTVLRNLSPGTAYYLQADAGCPLGVSNWTPAITFNTLGPVVVLPQTHGGGLHQVTAYPNPSPDGHVRLDIPKAMVIQSGRVLDLQGRVVQQLDLVALRAGRLRLDPSLARGVYLLDLTTSEGPQAVRIVY
ncbi:MAG: G8 domain-containing protein [Bacteroidota bacterium]